MRALSPHPRPGSPAEGERPVSSVAFDAVMVMLSAWFLGGLYLDGWAHQHIARAELETFFTPWHAMLYSGLLASAGALGLTAFWNWRDGYTVLRAAPVGYEWPRGHDLASAFWLRGRSGSLAEPHAFGSRARHELDS